VQILLIIVAGLVIGAVSGIVGLGGGFLAVPFLRYLMGLSQHDAQGTTMVMLLPPIGLLGAYAYWKAGHVNIPMALFLALGFIFGAYFGAVFANLPQISGLLLQRIFGFFFLLISLRMLFGK